MRQKMSFGELPQEKGYLNEGEVLQIPLANGNACSNEQKGSSKGIRASQRLEVKTCPVCGARCFSDMDTCYNCLHSFVHDGVKSEEASPSRNGQFTTMAHGAERSSALDSRPSGGRESISDLRNRENGSKPLANGMDGIGPVECEEAFGDYAKAPLVSLEKGVEVIVNISFAKSPCSKNGETVPTVMIETR